MTDSYGTKLKIGDLLLDEEDGDILEVVTNVSVCWKVFLGSADHEYVVKQNKVRLSTIKGNCRVRKLSKLDQVLK